MEDEDIEFEESGTEVKYWIDQHRLHHTSNQYIKRFKFDLFKIPLQVYSTHKSSPILVSEPICIVWQLAF